MVKILSKLKVIWLKKTIKKANIKKDFYVPYLEIQTKKYQHKFKQKLEKLELKKKNRLIKFEVKAGIESDFLKADYEMFVSMIEKKYYWKKRALEQKIKRKKITNQSLLENLDKKLTTELTELKNQYFLKDILPKDKTFCLNRIKVINQKYLVKSKKLENKKEKILITFSKRIKFKIEKYTNKLREFKQKLNNLEIRSNYKLDDKVLLKIDKLSMYFGGLKAVDELSFEVKEGEIFGLIGPNGAGKTTVFNCITKFYNPTDGDMYFKNKIGEVVRLNDILVHNIIREGISRTFQNVEMIWELNVLDNLLVAAHTNYQSTFFGHLFNSHLLKQEEVIFQKKAITILKDLQLEQYTYTYPLGLPYGILKKIELARTLMVNPSLIILDEPAAGLNDTETASLAETIKKIRSEYKTTIFLVEHDMGLVMDICDTVCTISFGHKLAIGTPKEIQNSKVVQEAYLGGE